MDIPFLDLTRQSPLIENEIEQALLRIARGGWYVLGPELESFEREFAEFMNVPFAVGVASGTEALTIAIQSARCIEAGRRDEVITSALSAAFTPLAIHQAGGIPRFVDVDATTLQMDVDKVEECMNERTCALVPVHLYGHACRIERLRSLADKYGLALIEDACQAHGASLNGKALGSFGRAGAFSFYPTKNLGAMGDAGLIVTAEAETAQGARMLRHGGQDRVYHHAVMGWNSRLDEIQAGILRVKLRHLEAQNEIRRRIARQYDDAFSGLELKTLLPDPGVLPNRHLYPVRTNQRDELRAFLLNNGIQSLVHYPTALPGQPALRQFVRPGQSFPCSEKATRELLSLPLYPELTENEVEFIIRAVRRFFGVGPA